MEKSLQKMLKGYQSFRRKYALGQRSIMRSLSQNGQQPKIMVVACCDSRVDPALILQCDPGDLFVVRNVANIVPPYEKDEAHHGTSAALEFAIGTLKVNHLILLGHSQCGGIQTLLNQDNIPPNDFITNWVSILGEAPKQYTDVDTYAKSALRQSYENCLGFPWIQDRLQEGSLTIHQWFFDIKTGQVFAYDRHKGTYTPLS